MTCSSWLCKATELATNAKAPTCKNGPCQACLAVAKINKEIDQAVATLRGLLAKRCDLRSKQNHTHDLVHRLPTELQNYTFELLLPLQDEWGEIPQAKGTVGPSCLASICRGWRDIAWSNPFLWSIIHILLEKSNSDFVHDRIQRSRTLPLTFNIKTYNRSDRGLEQRVLAPVLDAMNQCFNRMQSLSLQAPFAILRALHDSSFQWHCLKQLRILSTSRSQHQSEHPLSLFNPTASPEKIELDYYPPQLLQISWNRLSRAEVRSLDLEGLTQLFQHASQMTDCCIFYIWRGPESFSMAPITHHRLKTLTFHNARASDVVTMFLGSLTLPCLQEFDTDEIVVLSHLHALVHRSSCPLTRLTLCQDFDDVLDQDHFEPLPGVTDLVVETPRDGHQAVLIQKFLLEEYFPDLRHLTLRLEAFLSLWDRGVIPLYLDRKRPRSDGPNEGRLHRFLVVDQDQASEFDGIWNSEIGEELKALNISLREDGFEFL